MAAAGRLQTRKKDHLSLIMQKTHHHLFPQIQREVTDECHQQRQKTYLNLLLESQTWVKSRQAEPPQTQQHLHPTKIGEGAAGQAEIEKEGYEAESQSAIVAENGPETLRQVQKQISTHLIFMPFAWSTQVQPFRQMVAWWLLWWWWW